VGVTGSRLWRRHRRSWHQAGASGAGSSTSSRRGLARKRVPFWRVAKLPPLTATREYRTPNLPRPCRSNGTSGGACVKAMLMDLLRRQSVVILVVTTHPFHGVFEPAFITSLGYEVEVMIGTVQHVDTSRIGRIRVKDLASLVFFLQKTLMPTRSDILCCSAV
jgi:hypothetical protein